MSSNYPPGVTGNEWQIRGMDEGTAFKECGVETDKLHIMPHSEWDYLHMVFDKIKQLREKELDKEQRGKNSSYTLEVIDWTRKSIIENIETIEKYLSQDYTEEMLRGYTDECPFKGNVDIQYGDGYLYWECPLCGTEHEEEIDTTPDDPRI